MKFNIIGLDDTFGKHRFSNNSILEALYNASEPTDELHFVWWLEKVFLNQGYDDEIQTLLTKKWFGVLHVPLLTPNWAMYSQNNISKLYFSDKWRKALENCVGLIALSEHLAQQIRALYPGIPVFSLKHPVGYSDAKFCIDRFNNNPTITLVGAWLRDYSGFVESKSQFRKQVLYNHYAEGFLRERYSKYDRNIMDKLGNVKQLTFLSNDEYDELLTSTLVFIGMHETSANNALCECIAYGTPFVAYKHPAVIEYVGDSYPLLVNDYSEIESIDYYRVKSAAHYLSDNPVLKDTLSIESFVSDFKIVFRKLTLSW